MNLPLTSLCVFSVYIACVISSVSVSRLLRLLLLLRLRLCVRLQVLINLFLLMVPAGMPELSSADEIQYLRDMLMLDMNDAEAWKIFHAEMDSSLKNWFKQLDNTIHIIKHSLG